MKLLHVTDFHSNRRWFKWVADHAEEYDLIVYSGDFLDIFGAESLGSQVRWICDGLRSRCRKACRFKSCPEHHSKSGMTPTEPNRFRVPARTSSGSPP